MTILFEQLLALPINDTGTGRARLTARGLDASEPADTGDVQFDLAVMGEDEHAGDLVITIPDFGSASVFLGAAGADGGLTADWAAAAIDAMVTGFDLRPGEDAGGGAAQLRASGFEIETGVGYAYLVAPPPVLLGYGGLQYDRVVEELEASGITVGRITAALRARVGVAGLPTGTLTGLALARDSVDLGDALAVIARALVDEGFELGDSAAPNYTAITRVADALRLAGVTGSTLDAMNLVVAGIAYRAIADIFAKERVLDGFDMGEAVADALHAAARLVESLLVGGEAENSARFGAMVLEGVHVGAGIAGVADLLARLHEGVEFALHLNVEGDQATAYVLNTELGAAGATTYQNYPFNSFARIGGEHGEQYGMTPDGIRRIGGDSDAGAPINAAARFAMTNLGSGVAKRMQAAYLGYASNGDIRLKAIVVAPDGKREAWCYRMIDMPGEDVQQARIQIGQGLKSVYWGFGLESIDGSSFTLDLIDLHPLVLDQRMLGQGGGRR